jgi:hypothetical protein
MSLFPLAGKFGPESKAKLPSRVSVSPPCAASGNGWFASVGATWSESTCARRR